MHERRFSWGANKAEANQQKHGVRFTDAVFVFGDPYRTERLDDRYGYGEERWVTTGMVRGRVLVVVYTEDTDEDNTTRLISARRARRDEQEGHYRARHRGS
ncbi:hypothetical protein CMK11_09220 [Candidatus Poribacteria bacterium]|nr:hypothetical protein [Candidatus Poribacteria bacterium]